MHHTKTKIAHLAVTLSAAFALTACSKDVHRFYSSVDKPTNVTVYDPASDRPLWEKQVPVGQMLEIDFERHKEREWQKISLKPATQFTWKLYRDNVPKPIDTDTVGLPGVPVIMKVTYRPGPEYPPGYTP